MRPSTRTGYGWYRCMKCNLEYERCTFTIKSNKSRMCIRCFNEPGKVTKKPRKFLTVPYRLKKGLPVSTEEFKEFHQKDAERCRIQTAVRRLTTKGRAQMLLSSARIRARKKKIPFNLSLNWLYERMERGVCEVTGIPFDYSAPTTTSTNKFAPSLDRQDNSKGYTEDNTAVVVWLYNVAKRDFSSQEILEFAIQFAENRNPKYRHGT